MGGYNWLDTRLLEFLCQFDLKDSPKKLKTLTKNLWGLQALKNHQRGPSNKGHCRSKQTFIATKTTFFRLFQRFDRHLWTPKISYFFCAPQVVDRVRREVGIDGEGGFKLYGSTSTLKNLVIVVEFCMDVSKNRGIYPQIIHFNRLFHYFHHPFWGKTPYKAPILILQLQDLSVGVIWEYMKLLLYI